MRYPKQNIISTNNVLPYFTGPNKMCPTIQSSRGPQPCYASFEVNMSHRVLYMTSLSVTSTQGNGSTLIFADFKDKSRSGKGFDVVTHRTDQSGSVIARSKFNRNKDFDITWENGQTTSVARQVEKKPAQDLHLMQTSWPGWGTSLSPPLYWRFTWDYEASENGFGNLELVNADGKPYAVLVTVAHKSWSKIGTLYILADSMDSDMLDLVLVTMLSMVKKLEKDGWQTNGGGKSSKTSDYLAESAAEKASESITESLITAAFGG